MDSQPEDKKTSGKLKLKSREYVPPAKLKSESTEFHPSTPTQPQDYQEVQTFEDYNQINDQYNQQYMESVNYYMGLGYSQDEAVYYTQNPPQQYPVDPNQQTYGYEQQEYYDYPEQNQAVEEEEQKEGEQSEEQAAYGAKTKKPHGNKRKEKYQGKHHEKYADSEEGYYDELGFYYLPDGSFYDPDGYYFDPNGYDQYGGYYDDNANYIAPEGKGDYYKGGYKKRGRNYEDHNYHFGDQEDYYDEDFEDKYTKDYIQFVIEAKYYEDLEYLKNSPSEWAYLTVGNLAEGTVKQDLLKYFGNQGIDTSQITIVMSGSQANPVGNLEIYKKPVAIQVLKLCGQKLNGKEVVIEVDQKNEKLYGNDHYNEYEYGDPYESRYTKYDDYPAEEDAAEAKGDEAEAK